MQIRPPPRVPRSLVISSTLIAAGLVLVGVLALYVLPDREPPSRVLGVQAEDRLGGTLVISWIAATDNVAVLRYRVYRDGSEVAAVRTPSYEDAGLPVDVTFEYRVAAEDEAGNIGARSDALLAASAPLAPGLQTLGWAQVAPSSWSLEIESATASIEIDRFEVSLVSSTLEVVVSPRPLTSLPATAGNLTLAFTDAPPIGELSAGDVFTLATTGAGAEYRMRVVYLPSSETVLFESLLG